MRAHQFYTPSPWGRGRHEDSWLVLTRGVWVYLSRSLPPLIRGLYLHLLSCWITINSPTSSMSEFPYNLGLGHVSNEFLDGGLHNSLNPSPNLGYLFLKNYVVTWIPINRIHRTMISLVQFFLKNSRTLSPTFSSIKYNMSYTFHHSPSRILREILHAFKQLSSYFCYGLTNMCPRAYVNVYLKHLSCCWQLIWMNLE